ncbi:MAG TPA: hypothetical protein VMJ93_06160 [Verrucomicrobiae bacterium]|nr:hypothetical protein [Verrucomicrobiae bacterium]
MKIDLPLLPSPRSWRFFALLLAGISFVALFSLSLLAGDKPSNSLSPDKGKLRILINGTQAGEEEFEISRSGSGWTVRGSSQLATQQGSMRISGNLSLRPDGSPLHYDWTTQGPKKASSTIDFNGTSATAELHVEGMRPYSQTFTFSSPRIVVLDNNLYHQYDVLAHLYDWQKKGIQTFAVLVPQELTPGTITLDSVGKQDFNGKSCEELVAKTEDLELDVYVDGPRLMGIVVPSSGVQILRE